MLIKCPECELQVSDKAIMCPHCGYVLDKQASKNINRKQTKRKRLPNGFGRITKIKGQNLRKPYRAVITVGTDDQGKFLSRNLKPHAYFATYNEAYEALVEYHRNPYDLDSRITVAECFEKWSAEYFSTLKSKSSQRTITSAWAYCSELYGMQISDVRARHIKGCMENGKVKGPDGTEHVASAGTKARIKSLWNLMLDYAVEYELTDRNYARTFEISSDVIKEREEAVKGHMTYSSQEIEKLWQNINIPYVDVILIQCYSGWRPQELGLIRLEDVNLENWTFKGGMKTDAGTDRIVPIHSKIKELVKKRYDEAININSEYLINCMDSRHPGKLTYDKFNYRYEKIRDDLGLAKDHRPHDGRKQFVTWCKKYHVDDFAIKRMVGHQIEDLTERVYTERDISWLTEEIEKIKE